MKPLEVVCALIQQGSRTLITQRGPAMRHPGKWEFPGGKVEAGESPTRALIREIREELHLEVAPQRQLLTLTHTYPERTISLTAYLCTLKGGIIQLSEHQAWTWIRAEDWRQYDWLEGDLPICRHYFEPAAED